MPGTEVCGGKGTARLQQPAAAEVRRLADRVEDEVEGPAESGEILGGVVDHVVGAQGPGELEMLGGDDRRHLGAVGLGKLDRRGADGAGRAVDEDPLWPGPRPNRAQIGVRVQGALADHRFGEG